MTLIERLRQAAAECSGWDPDMNAPYSDWSDLMDEAASALDQAYALLGEDEDDMPIEPRIPSASEGPP